MLLGKTKSLVLILSAVLLLAFLMMGCGKKEQSAAQQSPDAKQAEQTAAFPKTIKHAKGETVLKSKPAKIAITYFPYAEHLFAIDEASAVGGVVGLKSLKNFPVYDSYTKDGAIADLGDEANLEKILELNPDVIIAWEADEKIYDQLVQIAPTILIHSSENWQGTITQVASVLGEEEKAKQYIESYNQKLSDIAAKMDKSGDKGKTAIFMMTWGKGFNYFYGKRMEPYYQGLGFKSFDTLKDYGEISLEGVSGLNPDYIFLGQDFTESAEVTLKELETNPVWNNLNAVKNKHVFVVDTEIMGPLAMGQSKGLDLMDKIMIGSK